MASYCCTYCSDPDYPVATRLLSTIVLRPYGLAAGKSKVVLSHSQPPLPV